MQRTWKNKLGRALLVAILVALVVVFLYPLIFMALNSMKDKIEYYSNAFALPLAPTLDNYIALFNKFGIGRYLGNTLIISAGSLVLTLVCALFASYAFARMKFRGKSPAYLFIICTMFLPRAGHHDPALCHVRENGAYQYLYGGDPRDDGSHASQHDPAAAE